MWQRSTEAAAAVQSEVSRMGGMMSEASAAAAAAAQQVAALAETIAPLQQRLAAIEQQQHTSAEKFEEARNNVPTNGQEAVAHAAAGSAPTHVEETSDGSSAANEQLARLEQRLLSRLERALADGSPDGGRKRHGFRAVPRSAPCSRHHSPRRQRGPVRHRAWHDQVRPAYLYLILRAQSTDR